MQLLLHFVNIPVPAIRIISWIDLPLGFHFVSNRIDNLLLLVWCVKLSNLARCKKVIDVHQKSLDSDLSLGEEEENVVFFDSSLLVEILEVGFEIIDAVSWADSDLESSHIVHRCSEPW